jgi:hypothetical protein
MACGCSKKSVSAQANESRANRVSYRPTPVVEGLASSHALSGSRYSRVMYYVAPRDAIAAAGDDLSLLSEAEKLPTLAEAQKRIRDLGPTYGIKAIRA